MSPTPSVRVLLATSLAVGLSVALPLRVTLAAEGLTPAQELALDAVTLEFARYGVTATPQALAERFKAACERGYGPACARGSWLKGGRADLQAAAGVFAPSCEKGDPIACLVEGWAYDVSAPTQTDPEERDRTWRSAARLFKPDCERGFAAACHEYGWYLLENRGLKADPRAAPLRWRPACDEGFLPSCTTLGTLMIQGVPGIPRDAAGGRSLLDRACAGGDVEACYRLGVLDDAGWPGEKTHDHYARLCDEGQAASCYRLGLRYLNGLMVPPTPETTMDLMVRGCDLHHAASCTEAGKRVEQSPSPDLAKASALYDKACEGGDEAGCAALVELILADRLQGSVKTSTVAFQVACEQRGMLEACTRLASGLISGVDLPRDPARARELLHRSCTDAESDAVACRELARSYDDGEGGERDRTKASVYYRWACYQGDHASCYRRGELLTADVGVRRDDREAFAMFSRACQGNLPQGCMHAATIIDEATHMTRDVPEAARLFQLACEGGVGDACAGLGRLREEGIGSGPDLGGAREAYELGIAGGSIEAMRRHARLLWNGLGGRRDKGRARDLASAACQGGDPNACRGPEFL